MIYESYGHKDTYELARRLAEKAKKGSVYLLYGELGAGKTVFAKGFGKGLGVAETIKSPTFTIVNIYESGVFPLYHFDVYRVDGGDKMEDTGFFEYIDGGGVCLIEWAENIKDVLPAGAVTVFITKDGAKGDDYRQINILEPE